MRIRRGQDQPKQLFCSACHATLTPSYNEKVIQSLPYMINYFLRTVLMGCLLIAIPAHANILQNLLEAAMKHDDQLLLAQARLEEARSQTRGSLGRLAPQASVSIRNHQSQNECSGTLCTNTEVENSANMLSSLSLSQPIYDPARWAAYRKNRARAEQMGYSYAAARLDVFQRLLTQYIDILAETDRLRTLRGQRETLRRQLARIQAFVASGVRARVDLAEARAATALNEAQIEQSKINLQTFYEGLRESTKLSIQNLPPIRKDVTMPAIEPNDPNHWKEIALKQNFNLLAARKGVDAARHEIRENGYSPVPRLDLYSTYSRNEIDINDRGEQELTELEYGLRFNIPIYEGGSYANIKQARARRAQAERQLALLEIEVKTVVPSLLRHIEQGNQNVDAARQSMQARRVLAEQIELSYRTGSVSITELLEAYENFYQAERSYYSSLYAHIKNYADFYVRTGELGEETLAPFYDIADLKNYDPEASPY